MTTETALRASLTEMLNLMEEALTTHIYDDDDRIPADCGYVAAIQRAAEALGLPPRDIETVPVWSYSATFADKNGERGSFSTEVCAEDVMGALARGFSDLALRHRSASKIDASVMIVAGEVAP